MKDFVHGFEALYGKHEMVMNVHLLTHIVDSVRYLGPLWVTSAFGFERNNGILLKYVSGTVGVIDQISSKYLLKRYLQKSRVCENNTDTMFIGRPKIVEEISLTLYKDCSGECLKIKNKKFGAYTGIKKNGISYTSRLHKELKKSVDYFIGLESGVFGVAKYYVSRENQKYVFLEEYETMDSINHILEVEPTTINVYAPVESIVRKYIYMNVNNKYYISCMPNQFENE